MSFKQGGRNKNLSSFLIAKNRRKIICKKINWKRGKSDVLEKKKSPKTTIEVVSSIK